MGEAYERKKTEQYMALAERTTAAMQSQQDLFAAAGVTSTDVTGVVCSSVSPGTDVVVNVDADGVVAAFDGTRQIMRIEGANAEEVVALAEGRSEVFAHIDTVDRELGVATLRLARRRRVR